MCNKRKVLLPVPPHKKIAKIFTSDEGCYRNPETSAYFSTWLVL